MLLNPPSQAEFLDWKGSRVTKYLLAFKETEYESIKEGWARGDFTRESSDASNQLTAKALGKAEALYDVIADIITLGEEIDEETEH